MSEYMTHVGPSGEKRYASSCTAAVCGDERELGSWYGRVSENCVPYGRNWRPFGPGLVAGSLWVLYLSGACN